ncbi:MAG: cation diffusion facilitator family transporter [Bacilli bacterium]|nr:cation diffusion facilitator family transporter [Bacilli bacterium]
MTELLLKLFVKDYKNVKDQNVRKQYGVLGAVFGLITNFILFAAKLTIGILIANISIIADGLNNLSDFGNCFITIFGFKMSSKPADKDHPFGHQRMEYIISLIVSVIIISLGFNIGKDAVSSIITPSEQMEQILIPAIILGLSIVIKVLQGVLYYSLGKRIDSIALKATGADSRNDVISTTGVLIGLFISFYTGFTRIDGIIALVVAIFVVISGIKILIDTADILLGEKPSQEIIDEFVKTIKSHDCVLGIHDIEMHCYGPNQIYASCHVEVDASKDVIITHDSIDNIEKECLQKLKIQTVIHMDPVVIDDPQRNHFKEVVAEALKEVNPDLHFHDFRIVSGPTHVNLVFDIVLPFELKSKKDEIQSKLEDLVHQKEPNTYLVISYDDEYTTITSSHE